MHLSLCFNTYMGRDFCICCNTFKPQTRHADERAFGSLRNISAAQLLLLVDNNSTVYMDSCAQITRLGAS